MSMRLVDDAVREADEGSAETRLIVSSVGPFSSTVVDGLQYMARDRPTLRVELHSLPLSEVTVALLQGKLDLAVVQQAQPHADLTIQALGRCRYLVYCARSHPIMADGHPSIPEDFTKYAFAAPLAGDGIDNPDSWPVDIPRTVNFRFASAQSALRLVAMGRHLAVLPDLLVRSSPFASQLIAVPGFTVAEVTAYASYRTPLNTPSLAEQAATTLQQQWSEYDGLILASGTR